MSKNATVWRTGVTSSSSSVIDTESNSDLITESGISLIIEAGAFVPGETTQWQATQTVIGALEDEDSQYIYDESGDYIGDETFLLTSSGAPTKWNIGTPVLTTNAFIDTENSLELITEDGSSLIIEDLTYLPKPTDIWS